MEALENVFGGPSQAAFGTSVFCDVISNDTAQSGAKSLEQRAFCWYQFFCGESWEKFGPDNWTREWKMVYQRTVNAQSILNALETLDDRQARMNAGVMLEGAAEPQAAQSALSQAFDDPAVADLRIYRIGDGNAMSGILIAGQRSNAETAFVTFLMD
jgi:hypothetical protein